MNRSKSIKKFFLLIILFAFFSQFIAVGQSDDVGITDGLKVNHILTLSELPDEIPQTITFSKKSDDLFHVKWHLKGDIDDIGSWDVNTSTRIVSNRQNFGPNDGTHDFFWIYTDVSLNDQIIMFHIWRDYATPEAEAVFNITGEAMLGDMEVWQLEDDYGSVLWYEKTKGVLVNGTLTYLTWWHYYEFVSFSKAGGEPEIPGYNYFILIGIIAIVSFIIMKKQKSRI